MSRLPNVLNRAATVLARSVGAVILILVIAVAAENVARPTPAIAQTACGAHADIVKQLGDRYRERPIAAGLSSQGAIMEVFASKEGSTWTLVLTRPDGVSCLVATGESLQLLKLTKGGFDA